MRDLPGLDLYGEKRGARRPGGMYGRGWIREGKERGEKRRATGGEEEKIQSQT